MISWLQPEISNLMQLRELNLNWNQIRELPVEMGKLFRLEKLSFEGNNIVKPAPEVLALGTAKMLSYFRDRMLGTCGSGVVFVWFCLLVLFVCFGWLVGWLFIVCLFVCCCCCCRSSPDSVASF
jgi:hypothetical protein